MPGQQKSARQKESRGRSSSGVSIRWGRQISLTTEIEAILKAMFARFSQVAVEAEFGRGFSGSRAFRVLLIERGGRSQLPAVIKIAPASLILQEWQAYQTWVEYRLPNIARLETEPLRSADGQWAGLRYTLVGSGTFVVQSLYDYYQQASADDIGWVLENRLFEILGSNWWLDNRACRAYQMLGDYDLLLPVNLLINAAAPSGSGPLHLIEADSRPPLAEIKAGDRVRLQGLTVIKVDVNRRQLTLNLPFTGEEDSLSLSCRLRVDDVPDITRYRFNGVIDSLEGLVTATRHDLLCGHAGQALGEDVNLAAEQLILANGLSLPNPLFAYPTLLHNFQTVKISTVHGDLNLENILIDPATREVSLIDFATVRQGHVLHDLLRLETEVVVMLLPPAFRAANLPLETLYTFYDRLHRATFGHSLIPPAGLEKPFKMLLAIRRMVRKCLFNMDDWSEYYQGLALYLLGALKFRSLDQAPLAPQPKQMAFWGAAVVQHLLQTMPLLSKTDWPAPPRLAPPPGPELESPHGTMPPTSRFYIERTADVTCWQQISRPNAVTLFVQAPMQMGKSSLMRRMLYQAGQTQARAAAFVDLQKLPEQALAREEDFLVQLCVMIGDALFIPEAIDRYWKGRRANLIKCSLYLSQYILPQLPQPLLLAIDEVERMLTCPFGADFFGMLRTWHNDRVFDENFARLSLFLSSSTDPYLLIDNPNQSPFNVATLVQLHDFTLDEVLELNRRHPRPLQRAEVDSLMDLLAGHPFLTRVALYHLATGTIDLPALQARATDESGPFGDHLLHYLRRILQNPELAQAVRKVIHSQSLDGQLFLRLKSAGLIKREGQRLVWRNRLYERYFKEQSYD